MNLLLVGKPGVGKTTIVEQVVSRLRDDGWRLSGFFTRERRSPDGARTGFKIVTLDGAEGELARVGLPSPARVGRYGVNLAEFERLALPQLRRRDADLLVIDEIGKMECASARFRRAVEDALDAPTPVLATLGTGRLGFFAAVRDRPDVELLEVTEKNRTRCAEDILKRLRG
jgi:nucleoside-triphosphatase